MAGFVCTRCGKCCMRMGGHISIRARLGPDLYACTHGLGNQTFYARVEKRFRGRAPDPESEERGWCPFLVGYDGVYHCAIYGTRPPVCREFKCCRMRIYDEAGDEAGTVRGRRSLSTGRRDLREIWEREIEPLSIDDDDRWTLVVDQILARHGFTLEVYR